MRKIKFTLILVFIFNILTFSAVAQVDGLLSPEEELWLKERNNTIIVYPEKNFPPFSYQNTSGRPQGLSIDYIELIAKKVGAKIQYLPAQPLSAILDEVKQNKKGDIVTSVASTQERAEFLYFSDVYIVIPTVIVVRKDVDSKNTTVLKDLSGKKVAIGSKYAVEDFVRITNPKVVIESVIDDESGLQQLVLGEVDAVIMDIASLSYYLSKQVLNSVKVVGNAGFNYELSFAVPKDKVILQSIINKGASQIATSDRDLINDKWINLSKESGADDSFMSSIYSFNSIIVIYILIFLGMLSFFILFFFLRRNKIMGFNFKSPLKDLEEEVHFLEKSNNTISEELRKIQEKEEEINDKINSLNSPK